MFRLIRELRKGLRRSIRNWGYYFRWLYYQFLLKFTTIIRDAQIIQEQSSGVEGGAVRRPLKLRNYINPIFWLQQSFEFFLRFSLSRPVWGLIAGIPAMAGLLIPALIFYRYAPAVGDQIDRCRSQYLQTLASGNTDAARFYLQKWSLLAPQYNDPQLLFAELELQLGDTPAAMAILVELAKQGDLRAALRICRLDYDRVTKAIIEGQPRDAALESSLVQRLELLRKEQTANVDALMMLGDIYTLRQQDQLAIATLESLVFRTATRFPEAWQNLATLYRRQNKLTTSVDAALKAAALYLERVQSQGVTIENLMPCLRCYLLANNETAAVELVRAYADNPKTERVNEYRFLMAEILARWCERLRTTDVQFKSEEQFTERLNLLLEGLGYYPTHPVLMDELSRLALEGDVKSEGLDEFLERAIDSGVHPGLAHFILGTRALNRQPVNLPEAERHFQIAMSHDAAFPGLLNNLADFLADSESGDWDQGLQLVEQALRMMPGQPGFFDTRAKLKLRKGDAIGAISDFEKALSGSGGQKNTYLGLSKAYAEVGDLVKSKKYKILAEGGELLDNPKITAEDPR